MNESENTNLVIGLITEPKKTNLMTKFLLKLNPREINNFGTAVNKNAWLRRWLINKHGVNNSYINSLIKLKKVNHPDTFRRYLNSLTKLKNANMQIIPFMTPKKPPPYVNLKIGEKGFIQLEPVCATNYNKGVYIHYGETNKAHRGQGIGERLRKVAVNASRNSKIPLWQVSQNIEGLVKKGNLPISGKIMKKLGATEIPYPPPCRNMNVRGPHNRVFVVEGPTQSKRPRVQAKKPRVLKARRN